MSNRYGGYSGKYHHPPRQMSALIFVLKGLIPYTRENMMLAFKPNAFFNELEKISRYKKWTLQKAYYQAQKEKLIQKQADVLRLTAAGKKIVRPFIAEKLPEGAKLMVIFDIPEDKSTLRARFRRVLNEWGFKQVQKSVWVTSYDQKEPVKELVAELELDQYVELFECASIR